MILLLQDTAAAEVISTEECPICQTSVCIPCVSIVSNLEDLHRLLNGSLNTAPCPSCGTNVTAETPVMVNYPDLGIDILMFAPPSYLEMNLVCQSCADTRSQDHVFYSLGELALQVRARLRLSLYAANHLNPNDRTPLRGEPPISQV